MSPEKSHADRPGSTLEASRRDKLEKIRQLGHDPWGGRFDDHEPIGEIRGAAGQIRLVRPDGTEVELPPIDDQTDFRQWVSDHGPGQVVGPEVRAAGRIVLKRDTGKLVFADIRDWTGQIQLFIGKRQVGDDWSLVQCLDLGDIIGIDGTLGRTRTGELTIFATRVHLLTKSLEPPPEKHHGLADPELRQRMRYLDLTYGEGVLQRFLKRTQIVQSIRHTLAGKGFVEYGFPGAVVRSFE